MPPSSPNFYAMPWSFIAVLLGHTGLVFISITPPKCWTDFYNHVIILHISICMWPQWKFYCNWLQVKDILSVLHENEVLIQCYMGMVDIEMQGFHQIWGSWVPPSITSKLSHPYRAHLIAVLKNNHPRLTGSFPCLRNSYDRSAATATCTVDDFSTSAWQPHVNHITIAQCT